MNSTFVFDLSVLSAPFLIFLNTSTHTNTHTFKDKKLKIFKNALKNPDVLRRHDSLTLFAYSSLRCSELRGVRKRNLALNKNIEGSVCDVINVFFFKYLYKTGIQ